MNFKMMLIFLFASTGFERLLSLRSGSGWQGKPVPAGFRQDHLQQAGLPQDQVLQRVGRLPGRRDPGDQH